MKLFRTIMALAATAAIFSGCAARGAAATAPTETADEAVNLYTDRHYDSDDAIYAAFTEATGIKVNIVKGKSDELIERLKTEGEDTEADLFITADAGRLYRAQEAGLLQTTESRVLESNIPDNLREPDGYWFGLTKRARVIVYARDRVDESELSTYEDLTDQKWKGRILVRGADSVYNQTLIASFIELEGADKAKEWAEGIVANLARDPKGGDRDQAKAIAAGEGDIAIMNTYYLGLMLTSADPEERKVAEGLGVFFPDQEGNGTHINISGGGVIKGAKNAENAVKLLEFLSGEKAQSSYAQTNFEFPVLEGAESSEFLLSLGEFREQELSLSSLGAANAEAVRILTEAGWK
ncbi:Fe(3+) ABC transporter substrate-binding protein [Youngiibacter multivorans]|uniref:Iron(III) transport system substrate-binding protein n=1 Tax=Youngiibacter multivorans TaxID=937251 RepID=A0ABS4G053_9CLOT|nr:Fe(3+) ABC transporter substrate-binding protein [Youngiibacter multivorans]MBP1917917.1 iron(III) transport system substrate-binding protein [Youngiibacter multivorans]